MTKPCQGKNDAAADRGQVETAAAKPMSAAQMAQKLERLHELPILANVAKQVNQMLQDIETPAQTLAGFIEKDHAIVPKLLKLVNSAFFGFTTKVSNIRHAIMLMGYNTVRNAVLSIGVIDSLSLKEKFSGFDLAHFWRHAIAVGVVSRMLDSESGNHFKEDVFTAGLIHDIGKIVMANSFPDLFTLLMRSMTEHKLSFAQAERRCFPLTHDAVGAYLAVRWNLPEVMKETVGFHHQPGKKAAVNNLVLIVHVADALVHAHLGDKETVQNVPIDSLGWERFGDRINTARQWMPEAVKEIRKASNMLFER